ncbi:MAG: hypothetical protein HXS49_01350 [Theionarchaea archaeon]|nr:hypothetical protein [Theionarchaea archaeon]MBU7040212.1 hypothetical protein [Theionarchaea archaeon]
MKDNLETIGDMLGRIAAVFVILWLVAAVTDILGTYEYEVEFLQVAVGFHLLSRIPPAFKSRYSTGKKVQKFFTNLGWPLAGLWIGFKILRWIGWFGAMEVGFNIDYFLAAGIIMLLMGYAVKALRHKAGYWAARSVLLAIGGVSFLLWILIKIFDIFQPWEDYALVVGIIAIGLGYILGGLKRPPTFFVEIEDEEDAEPEIKEEICTLQEDLTISRNKATVKLNKGSLYIPVVTGDKEIGGIYFGEGSYAVDALLKVYKDVYRGVTVVTGREWQSVKAEQLTVPAGEDAFEDIGLKKEEVLEIARVQLYGKLSDEVKRRLKRTHVDLPFIKVRETPHGEYVKVGPIEVTETPEREQVRIGPWQVKDSYARARRFAGRGLYIQIRSKDEDITINTNGKTVLVRGEMQVTVNDKLTVKGENLDLVVDETRKILYSGKVKLICKENKRILHSAGFELIVREESGRIVRNGQITSIKDQKTLKEIRNEIDAAADELIKEVLDQGELKKLDILIKKFEQELS